MASASCRPHFSGIAPHADLGRLADLPGDRRADPRERLDEELADRRRLGFLEHADQAAQLDAVGMRLDLARFRRQRVGHPRAVPEAGVGIDIVQRHVGIGHGRLLQVFVDAAAAALVTGLQFDRHARAVIDFDPFDAVLLNVAAALVVGLDDHAFALAVEDLRAVALGVDLQLVVVRVGALGDLRHDLHRLAGREQAVHAGGADADALLAAAHPHAVELRAVQELAENQGNLLAEDARARCPARRP